MKNIKQIILLMLLAFSANSQAYFFETAKSYEMYEPRIVVTRSHTGFATGKICKECKVKKFKVTPSTQAYNLKGKRVDLQDANKWSGKAVVFTYDMKTKELLKIKQELEVVE